MNRMLLAPLCALILTAPALADDLDLEPGPWELRTKLAPIETAYGRGVSATVVRLYGADTRTYQAPSTTVKRVAYRKGAFVGRLTSEGEAQGVFGSWELSREDLPSRPRSVSVSCRGLSVVHTWEEKRLNGAGIAIDGLERRGEVEVLRLVFSRSEQAVEFATDWAPLGASWLVEVRGNEVVVVNADAPWTPVYAQRLRTAAWNGFGSVPAQPLLLGVSDASGNRSLFVRTSSASVSSYVIRRLELARQRTRRAKSQPQAGLTVRHQDLVLHWLTPRVVAYRKLEGAAFTAQVGVSSGEGFLAHYVRGQAHPLRAYAELMGEEYGAPTVILPEFDAPAPDATSDGSAGFCETLKVCEPAVGE
jgi:hypothetical protein